jgi:hypothetical protein
LLHSFQTKTYYLCIDFRAKMLFRLRIDIAKLTQPQIRRLRGWLLVAIVGVMCIQSILTALLVFSLDNPLSFQESCIKSEHKVSKSQQRLREQLLSLLDFGQEPTKKKQASLNLYVFNLFVEDVQIEVPVCVPIDTQKKALFAYLDGKGLLLHQKIPHPPRFV